MGGLHGNIRLHTTVLFIVNDSELYTRTSVPSEIYASTRFGSVGWMGSPRCEAGTDSLRPKARPLVGGIQNCFKTRVRVCVCVRFCAPVRQRVHMCLNVMGIFVGVCVCVGVCLSLCLFALVLSSELRVS